MPTPPTPSDKLNGPTTAGPTGRTAPVVDSVAAVMRRIALPVYAPSLLAAIAQNAVQILLPLYALELGGGAALAAAVVGLRGAGTMLGDVPAGMLVARFGDKGVMIAGLAVTGGAALAAALANGAVLLGCAALGFGAGVGVWLLARLSFITASVPIEQRGRVISVMAGMQRGGALLGPIIAGVGAELVGFRTVLIGATALFALATGLVLAFTANTRPCWAGRGRRRLALIVRRNAKTFATAGSVMVILSFLRAGRLLMIPLVGTELGLSPAQIGLAFSLSAAIDMAMFYPAGVILDRLGRKWALAPALLLLGAGIAVLPLATDFWTFAAAAFLAGLGNGFGTGIFMTLGGDFSPQRGRGEFLGVWRLVGDAGAAGGPFVMGAVVQGATLAVACAGTGALALVGVFLLVALVPKTLPRRAAKRLR